MEEMRIKELECCSICPRGCRINRYEKKGYCGCTDKIIAAKAYLHKWEEPCISGENGSGTVFFSGCSLGCIFCQNYEISHKRKGTEISIERLSEIFLELQDKGAHNINLVTPTHYVPQISRALIMAKDKGLSIPIIYNSSGYEKVSTLKMLEGLVDVYLPDIKYFDNKYAMKYSKAPEYFKHAKRAVLEMVRQVGCPVFKDGLIVKGVMVRHMMLPGLLFDSKKIVDWVVDNLPEGVYFDIMCQYTPMYKASEFPEINKRVNEKCYDCLIDYALSRGIVNGFIQDFDSASEEYIPDFDLEGI